MGPLRHDCRRYWVVAANANTKYEPPAEYPGHLQLGRWDAIRQGDAHDKAQNPNDELVAINESATIYISEVAKGQLPNNITHIRRCVDESP